MGFRVLSIGIRVQVGGFRLKFKHVRYKLEGCDPMSRVLGCMESGATVAVPSSGVSIAQLSSYKCPGHCGFQLRSGLCLCLKR